MTFSTISVKETIKRINALDNGWFLPAVQRPYVWGSRYESEKYICKLFDSILKGYPIGTLIVWNTDKEVPYRRFMDDYHDGIQASLVDQSLWSRRDKWLVYDGQQRLQTLYSCLCFTLNNRVLTYNLLMPESDEENNYGFEFVDKGATLENGKISMPQLFCQSLETKIAFKRSILSQIPNMDEKTEILFEQRFDRLFSVFVGEDIKSLAYFPIDSTWDEDRVNDVFERLNTGGVPLTGADLLFTKIKQNYEKYEEQLFDISKWIKEVTNGYIFTASEILQLINLIVKGTTRIDASKIKREDVDQFESVRNSIAEPLKDFFANFIYNSFNINNNSIISRKLAMLPLIVYSYKQFINGIPFNRLDAESIKRMKQYFIISQLNDWNTQGIIEGAVRKINESADFPFDAITTIAQSKNRLSTINASTIENNIWFSLKIMLPSRLYTLADSVRGRYKPELDHIFPKNLDNKPANYEVDTIWNLQPVQGKTNLLKSNTHPKLFFTDAQTAHFISEYDFVPQVNDSKWDNHKEFIEWRKAKMIEFINSEYGIVIL